MLVGTITPPDRVVPAESISEQPTVNSGLLILIDGQGNLSIDGAPILTSQLPFLAELDADSTELTDVRIKPDANLSAARLTEVLNVLREKGVQSVRLLTTPAEK